MTRANPQRDAAFSTALSMGHRWECGAFYAGWDACVAAISAQARASEAEDAAVDIGDGYRARKDGSVVDPDGKTLLPYVRHKGYLCVSLWRGDERREEYVHRVMAEAFCTKRSELQTQVNHRDGDRTNNAASNLEWCSPAENTMHAARVLFALQTRPVIATRLSDGHELHFSSLAEANEHGFKHGNIQKVLAGERKSHGGYSWRDAARANQGDAGSRGETK